MRTRLEQHGELIAQAARCCAGLSPARARPLIAASGRDPLDLASPGRLAAALWNGQPRIRPSPLLGRSNNASSRSRKVAGCLRHLCRFRRPLRSQAH